LRGTGTQIAYDLIRSKIISLEFPPGTDLDEAEIVTQLGLSRTPVREAIIRLASERLVEISPNRGARVTGMGIKHIREHLESYDLIQRTVTRWAAMRRTEKQLEQIIFAEMAFKSAVGAENIDKMIEENMQFHASIGAACGNESMKLYYDQLLTDALRIVRLAVGSEYFASADAYRAHVGRMVSEHADIVRHIKACRPDDAEAVAHIHAELGRNRVLDFMSISASPEIAISYQSHVRGE